MADEASPAPTTTVARLRARFERSYVGQCVDRVIELQPFDRGLALASRAFVALLPLTLVASSLSPAARDGGFAQGLIDRFGLEGDGADAVRRLFATPADVRGSVTLLGLLVLLYSVWGFARLLARLYEAAWHLPTAGLRGAARGLAWVAVFAAYIGVVVPLRHSVAEHTGSAIATISVLATSTACWLLTPYLLLAGRIPYRSLLPTGLLSAIAIGVYAAVSTVYMPDAMSTSAERYGLVGVAFSMVSWLIGLSVTLLLAAAVGAVTAERWMPPAARPAGGDPRSAVRPDGRGASAPRRPGG